MFKYHCTNCSYVYSPYIWDVENNIEPVTLFEDIEEFWSCPSCCASKDEFVEIKENIQELTNNLNIIPEEETHIPFYRVVDDKIFIRVWSEEEPFLWDDNHFIEYVWIFDEGNDIIDIKYLPDFEENEFVEFDLPDDIFEIRASCNIHWVWKWINMEELDKK